MKFIRQKIQHSNSNKLGLGPGQPQLVKGTVSPRDFFLYVIKGGPMIPKTTAKILKEIFFTPNISILMKFLVLVVIKRRYLGKNLVTKRRYLGKNLVTKRRYLGNNLVTKRSHLGTNPVTKTKNLRAGQDRSGQVIVGISN